MPKERKRGWQDPYVKKAFDLARTGDIPPVVVDAMRRMSSQIQDKIAQENTRAAATPLKRKSTNDGSVALGAGAGVGALKEAVDYIFLAGWGDDRVMMGFLQLPLIDGGIVAIMTTVMAFCARKAK